MNKPPWISFISFFGAIGVILLAASRSSAKSLPVGMANLDINEMKALNSPVDQSISNLSGQYNSTNVSLLEQLSAQVVLATNPATGEPLSNLQQYMMMSQACQESGLLGSAPNLHLIKDFNNYTGIKANSRYPAGPSTAQYPNTLKYVQYPSIAAFVADWLVILNFDFGGGKPIDSANINDYITRLILNQYMEDTASYRKNVPYYFDLLTNGAFA